LGGAGVLMEKFKVIVDENGTITTWLDGCLVHGIVGIEFYWEVGEVPQHKIEFASQATRIDRKYSID
jgi:hypothetical protein